MDRLQPPDDRARKAAERHRYEEERRDALKRVDRAVRRLLRDPDFDTPPIPILVIAENLGVRVEYEQTTENLAGFLLLDGEKPIIGVNALQPPTRQRFTIAHSLGHLVLGHEGKVFVERTFFRQGINRAPLHPHDQAEAMASVFAGELLVPAKLLARDIRDEEIDYEDDALLTTLAERYEVSTQLITIRLGSRVGAKRLGPHAESRGDAAAFSEFDRLGEDSAHEAW